MPTQEAALANHFSERFPLFDKLAGCFGCCLDEDIPGFINLLLCLAEKYEQEPCCVVVPEAPRVAQLLAVLLGLNRFKINYPNYVQRYAENGLDKGQNVRILPSGHVFRYEGIWRECPHLFKLTSLSTSRAGGTKAFPVEQIARLEPTDRKRPLGLLNIDFSNPDLSPIDSLLNITTYGNTSLYDNNVILLDSKVDFERMLEETYLFSSQHNVPHTLLKNLLPWGDIGNNGEMNLLGPKPDKGIPLIAVSSICENIAAACENAEPFTKTVIASSPVSLTNDPQCYDAISENQHLLVFADNSQWDRLRELQDRESRIWAMTSAELLLGEPDASRTTTRKSYLGNILIRAENASKLASTSISCGKGIPGMISESLFLLSRSARGGETEELTKELVGKLYDVLRAISGWCQEPGSKDLKRLDEKKIDARSLYLRNQQWLSPEHRQRITQCLDMADEVIAGRHPELGRAKKEGILEKIRQQPDDVTIALVACTSGNRINLEALLTHHGIDGVSCYQVGTVPGNEDFDLTILTTWPGQNRIQVLMNRDNTREICLVGYEHEIAWFEAYQRRRISDRRLGRLDRTSKAKLSGIPEKLIPTMQEPPNNPPDSPETNFIFRIEKTLRELRPNVSRKGEWDKYQDAKFVRFFGNTWAYLANGHSVPCVNSILIQDTSEGKIIQKTVADIGMGDYLMFREGSDRHVIEFIAKRTNGEHVYENLIKLAHLWKSALYEMGDTPRKVRDQLADHGLRRTETTVRGWMYHDNTIGPNTKHDLEVIATASGHDELGLKLEKVWDAIRKIRSFHIEAGSHLSRIIVNLMEKKELEISGEEIRVDLQIGTAWIVQVDFVGEEQERIPYSSLNRLMWDDDD